jgi:hypothetical protein
MWGEKIENPKKNQKSPPVTNDFFDGDLDLSISSE